MAIRVLLVDDSSTVRTSLRKMLAVDPAFEIVAEAQDGPEAIELCEKLRPDVISLDMALPTTNGLEVTKEVMARFPTAILIVSASLNRSDQLDTYAALAAGAVDVLAKPDADTDLDSWATHYRRRLTIVSRVSVITHVRGRKAQKETKKADPAPELRKDAALIAVGASTGGPTTIATILRLAGDALAVPTLMVVHTADGFDTGLASWLGSHTPLPVSLGRHGERLGDEPRVVLAPSRSHLRYDAGEIRLDHGPARMHCKPSVDVLFESLVGLGGLVTAVLLSGMGRDGAEGLRSLREDGAMTIAQDEPSSVVWGMPGRAVEIGAARRVLSPADIAAHLACVQPAG